VTEQGPGVLWTAMPLELVTAGLTAAPDWVEHRIEGRLVLVAPAGDGTGRIERLLSTAPDDYLNPRFAPGSVVHLG
jgi:hypothetical protein